MAGLVTSPMTALVTPSNDCLSFITSPSSKIGFLVEFNLDFGL